jgi:glucose-1-phosphate thymidylyltransferase
VSSCARARAPGGDAAGGEDPAAISGVLLATSQPPSPDPLFPIANRPLVAYGLDVLHAAGVRTAAVVVDASAAEGVRAAIAAGATSLAEVTVVPFDLRAPESSALAAAVEIVGLGSCLVVDAGSILLEPAPELLGADPTGRSDGVVLLPGLPHGAAAPGAMSGLERLTAAGACLLSGNGVRLLRAHPLPGRRVAGLALSLLELSGVLETRAVEGWHNVAAGYESLLAANRAVLQRLPPEIEVRATVEGSKIEGPVLVHPSAVVRRSLVRGPAVLGAGCRVTDAYVGPYTSLGDDVTIEGAEIEHSIVRSGAHVEFVGTRIEGSVLGARAFVGRDFDMPAALRLWLGNGARVRMG